MTPANPRPKSVQLLETFSLELLSCQKVDDQVCTASFHEVLVASGIVGVCKIQVPVERLSDTPSVLLVVSTRRFGRECG